MSEFYLMATEKRYIIFPASRDEFPSLREYENFLRNTVPSKERNGIYHIRTKKKLHTNGRGSDRFHRCL